MGGGGGCIHDLSAMSCDECVLVDLARSVGFRLQCWVGILGCRLFSPYIHTYPSTVHRRDISKHGVVFISTCTVMVMAITLG